MLICFFHAMRKRKKWKKLKSEQEYDQEWGKMDGIKAYETTLWWLYLTCARWEKFICGILFVFNLSFSPSVCCLPLPTEFSSRHFHFYSNCKDYTSKFLNLDLNIHVSLLLSCIRIYMIMGILNSCHPLSSLGDFGEFFPLVKVD